MPIRRLNRDAQIEVCAAFRAIGTPVEIYGQIILLAELRRPVSENEAITYFEYLMGPNFRMQDKLDYLSIYDCPPIWPYVFDYWDGHMFTERSNLDYHYAIAFDSHANFDIKELVHGCMETGIVSDECRMQDLCMSMIKTGNSRLYTEFRQEMLAYDVNKITDNDI